MFTENIIIQSKKKAFYKGPNYSTKPIFQENKFKLNRKNIKVVFIEKIKSFFNKKTKVFF